MTQKTRLIGRQRELVTIDALLRSIQAGRGQTLVLRGEAGIGKSALLDGLAERAAFARVLRASGVESESKLPFAALQQLCAPLAEHLQTLPEPQRTTLETAFGLAGGPVPEPLLVGVGALGLFAAEPRPLICVVDDAQWIDAASLSILGFVARRLSAEAVGLVFAARDTDGEQVLPGLPELRIEGMPNDDARVLLEAVPDGPVDTWVRDRIIAETRGNPSALLESSLVLSPADLAFGFGGRSFTPLAGRMEMGYQRRIGGLPAETRILLIAAALEPVGDPLLLWRALHRLRVPRDAVEPAVTAGLLVVGPRVRFPHPLMRSAAWRSADTAVLRAVHAALAEVTDPGENPDRRAWHRAHAAVGQDDEVATALEGSAGRARARGGWSAAATFLERAGELTRDPARASGLLIAAAAARADAGSYALVSPLLAAAELSPLDALQQAQVERLRAEVTFALEFGASAPPALLAAARRLQKLDPVAARDTFITAIGAAVLAGRFGSDSLRLAAEAARSAGLVGDTFPDQLLAGLVSCVLDGRATAAPLLHRALAAAKPAENLGLFWVIGVVAEEIYQPDLLNRMSELGVHRAREVGALSQLPNILSLRANSLIAAGRFADAERLHDEISAVTQITGASACQWSRLALAAYHGPESQVRNLIGERLAGAAELGNGWLHAAAHNALAIMHNGLGNHQAAAEAAREAVPTPAIAFYQWSLGELVEASARAGWPAAAAEARERLAERTSVTPSPAALGAQALADALAGPPDRAEDHYRYAIELLGVSATALQGYRARLLFGEWLRRDNRQGEARSQLRVAFQAFNTVGATLFADRAARELAATGETMKKRQAGAVADLTAREIAIARMAATGNTNPQIAEALFLSPRTVEWHLRKVYVRLGITSRRDLAGAI